MESDLDRVRLRPLELGDLASELAADGAAGADDNNIEFHRLAGGPARLGQHRIVWRYQHPQRQFPFYSSAAVAANRIVIGGRDKMVHGLNAAGKGVWTFATRARVESSPAIAGGRVFVGSNDGRFYVLNLNTGAKLWEFTAGAPLSASPAIANGRIVIGSQDLIPAFAQHLRGFRKAAGKIIQT